MNTCLINYLLTKETDMQEYKEVDFLVTILYSKPINCVSITNGSRLKDAMPVSFRSILFTSNILTIFKQRNLLP